MALTLATSSLYAQEQEQEKIKEKKGEITSYLDIQEWERDKRGSYYGYIAKDGHMYCVGDKLTIGPAKEGKTYNYMWERVNVLHILAEAPTSPISGKWVGSTGVIKRIEVWGKKKSGFDVTVVLAVGELSRIEVRPFEAALASGEIVSEGMTRDKAIAELQDAKMLLDLGVITQEEYDVIKAKMTPYLRK